MIIFRNHSLRLFSVALLLFGLAPALMPAQASYGSTEDVSVWLHSFAGEHSPEQAWEKISHLNDLQDAPDLLLRKASKMINANADLFSLPVNNSEPTDEEVFNLLVQEWNRYQQTGSMGTAILSERHYHALPLESVKFIDAAFDDFPFAGDDLQAYGPGTVAFNTHRLHPLLSGVSINAP
ncbi:MAG: hypothetical protein WD038_06465 [Balneolales bacterium]